jgi:hypothetical protein
MLLSTSFIIVTFSTVFEVHFYMVMIKMDDNILE